MVSCDEHEHYANSREHKTESEDSQILEREQENTEKNPCNRNQRQPADGAGNAKRAGGVGGAISQDNNCSIDHDKCYKKREVGHVCNKGNVTGKQEQS